MKIHLKLIFFLIIYLGLSVKDVKSVQYITVAYYSYQPKTLSGQTITAEDYHTIQITFNNSALQAAQGSPLFTIKYADNAEGSAVRDPGDQTNINYTKEYFLPGFVSTNFAHSRIKPDNSVVKKYYVIYNIVGSCISASQNIAARIKYFYCFADARAFFENQDTSKGSGTGLKLIHNTINFEATQSTITFSTGSVNLRDAFLLSTGTC